MQKCLAQIVILYKQSKNRVCYKRIITLLSLCLFALNRGIGQPTSYNLLINSNTPSPRSGYAMAYDENRKIVVLFGGQDSTDNKLSDTWEWVNEEWKQIKAIGPNPRINATMTYDTEKKLVYLFGGRSAAGVENDLWNFDGISWNRIECKNSPSPRQLATMVFDKGLLQLVLFGGWDAKKVKLGDTWIMKDTQWTQLNITGPSPRASHSMIYNDKLHSVFMYGGYDTTALNDLWEFKEQTWHRIKTKLAPLRLHMSMAYDQEKGRILLFGGFNNTIRTNLLFGFTKLKWDEIKSDNKTIPEPRAEHESVYIPGTGLFIFGGVTGADADKRIRSNDTWIYNKSLWRKLN